MIAELYSIAEAFERAASRLGLPHETPLQLMGIGTASLSVVRYGGYVMKFIRQGTIYTADEQLTQQVWYSQRERSWISPQTWYQDLGVIVRPFVAGRIATPHEAPQWSRDLERKGITWLRDVVKPSNWIIADDGTRTLIDFYIDLNNADWRALKERSNGHL